MAFCLLLLAGGAISLCGLLLATYFLAYPFRDDTLATRYAAVVLLGCLGLEQLFHAGYYHGGRQLFDWPGYSALLWMQIGGFYVFSSGVLGLPQRVMPVLAGHGLLALTALLLPGSWHIPLAFAAGGGYAGYFSWRIYQLRDQYPRRALEFKIFAIFVVMAALMTLLGILMAFLPEWLVAGAYTLLVWCALSIIAFILIKFPDWAVASVAIARARYAQSTLRKVNCQQARAALEALLADPGITRDPAQSLSAVARRLELSNHQLSELINTEFQCGFSALLRRYRVADAQRQLRAEPNASVLAIGMAAGFTSQSNFYSAFREVAGCTPGAYRQKAPE